MWKSYKQVFLGINEFRNFENSNSNDFYDIMIKCRSID